MKPSLAMGCMGMAVAGFGGDERVRRDATRFRDAWRIDAEERVREELEVGGDGGLVALFLRIDAAGEEVDLAGFGVDAGD